MRRTDREVKDHNKIYEIIKQCEVCRLALFDDKFPYIIPLNFGVSLVNNQWKLYFHSANVGTKLELIKKNPHAAFEMDCSHQLALGKKACDATMGYQSVCGNGTIRILPEEEKLQALSSIMNQYAPDQHHEFGYNELLSVTVLELTVNEIHGKCNKLKTSSKKEEYGTLKSAVQLGKEDRITDWVFGFLEGVGENLALASGLKHQNRFYLGPVNLDLSLLVEPLGVPTYLTQENDIEWFYEVVERMSLALEEGWDMPPLIVEYTGGRYVVNDGKHRLAALREMGAMEAAAIIWTNSEEEYDEILHETGSQIIL